MTVPFLHLFADRAFKAVDELALQDEIARVLGAGGFAFEREVRLSDADRIDFLVGDIGLEVKTAGTRTQVIRQLHRYAQHERIGELVLATTRWSHASSLPVAMSGKRLSILPLYRGTL